MILSWTQTRSELANAIKDGASPERVAELRRDYRVARARQHLTELVASPPLTAEQRSELASVVLEGGGADAAAA